MAKHICVLANLGSPDSTSISDVRRYLAEFLMDKYVIDVPFLLRALIVYGTILPTRPKRTSHAYSTIWTEQGSPLVQTMKDLLTLVQNQTETPLYLCMRYGNPSIQSCIQTILSEHPDCESIQLIPFYPQYAMSSTLTLVEKFKTELSKQTKKTKQTLSLSVTKPFYKEPNYINCLVNTVKPHLSNIDYLLFSYHGLPERHLRKTDPTKKHCLSNPTCCSSDSKAWHTCYRHQSFVSTDEIVKALGYKKPYSIAYQSRLGNDPWLLPNTELELIRLAKEGVKNIHVICPSFTTDCLETLEEIAINGKETFLENGGENFTYIPCLNTNEDWVTLLSTWTKKTN